MYGDLTNSIAMSRYPILVRSQFVTERSTFYSMVIVETAIAVGDFGHLL